LAKDRHARVRVLNIIDDAAIAPTLGGYQVDMARISASIRDAGLKTLERSAALAEKAGVTASVAMIDADGRPVSDVILAEAKKFRADLIVMGTHGRRGINRLLLGSDAERVLRDATVPVLLIRDQQRKPVKARSK
jgi:nucleotide-binding universal stress UspA family protein